MKPPNRRFSLAEFVGTIAAGASFLALLINPDEAKWRIFVLGFAGVLFLIAINQWPKRTEPVLTLKGESYSDDCDTFLRKLPWYVFAIIAITVFGFVTWPAKEFGTPADAVVLTDQPTPTIQYHSTSKVTPPNPPDNQSGAKPPTGHIAGAPSKDVKPPKPVAPGPPTNVRAIAQ